MACSWTTLWLGCLSLGLAPLARSATESTTTTTPMTTHETPAVDLGALLDAGEGAEVTLVAGDTRLAAHRAVLTARSPIFREMLTNNTLEASSGQLEISDVEGPVLCELLVYLYTLQPPQMSSMAPQLLAAADKYGVSGLEAAWEQQLVAQLTVETAASSAVLAVRHSWPSLEEAAVAFIGANFANVVATEAWEQALVSNPKEMMDVIQLITELQAGTSTSVATDSGSAPGQTHSGSSQTPVASMPAPPACDASLPDDDTVSFYRRLSAGEKGKRLIEAAKEGAAGEVRALLAAGANVDARGLYTTTALHWAAQRGAVDVASCLIDGGAEVDARDWRQNTPLHYAVYRGHTSMVRLLAAPPADLSARDQRGRTPLHDAARLGHAEVAAVLLEAGADKRISDNGGRTPLDFASNQQLRQLLAEI